MIGKTMLGLGAGLAAVLAATPAQAERYLGEIVLTSAGICPVDTKLANGAKVRIAEFPDLYAVIGTAYGGDGKTEFGLPDLSSQVLAVNDIGRGAVKVKGDASSAPAMRVELPIIYCVVTRVGRPGK